MRRLLLQMAMDVAGHFFHVRKIVGGQIVDLGPKQVDDALEVVLALARGGAFGGDVAVMEAPERQAQAAEEVKGVKIQPRSIAISRPSVS